MLLNRIRRASILLSSLGFVLFLGLSSCKDSEDVISSAVEKARKAAEENKKDEKPDRTSEFASKLRAELTPGPTSPFDSSQTSKIAFLAIEGLEDNTQEVVAFSGEGERLGEVTDDDLIKMELDYSPETGRVVFVTRVEREPRRFDLHSMNIDGTERRNLTLGFPTPEESVKVLGSGVGARMVLNRSPSWGADGHSVFFSTRRMGTYSLMQLQESTRSPQLPKTIRVEERDGNPVRQGASRRGSVNHVDQPDASPKELLLVCIQRLPGEGDRLALYQPRADGGEDDAWFGFVEFDLGVRPEFPRFSRDGSLIVYSAFRFEDSERTVYVVETEQLKSGKPQPRPVIQGPRSLSVDWATGSTLVLAGDVGEGHQIYLLDVNLEDDEDLPKPRKITETASPLYQPVWVEKSDG